MIEARIRAVEACGLAVELAPGRRVLDGIDLGVAAGEIVLLAGPSGAGKTTLLRAVRGLVPIAGGSLSVLGQTPRSGFDLRPDVAFVPQHLGLVRGATVLDNVLCGALSRTGVWRSWAGRFARAEVERALALLARLGLAHLADRASGSTSGGERQRTAIARAWMQSPRLVLADEFLAHLDPGTAEVVLREVEAQRAQGTAFLATTHDPALAERVGARVVTLEAGRVARHARVRAARADAHRAASTTASTTASAASPTAAPDTAPGAVP